jgi:two-component system sensor histidine kinase KdpD
LSIKLNSITLFQSIGWIILLLSSASGIGYLFSLAHFPETNIVIVYLLAILLISRFTRGYLYGIIASIIATLLFNYLFTSPYYTLAVDNPSYIITFIVMTMTALLTSALTTRMKKNIIKAQEKEAEAKALYNLTSKLSDAVDIHQIATVVIEMISNALNTQAACLCFDEKGIPEHYFLQQGNHGEKLYKEVDSPSEIKNQVEANRVGYTIGTEFYDWIIYGQENILGIIRIPKETGDLLTEEQRRILLSMIENTALAMDRVYLSKERLKSYEETTQERYRGNLLQGISHDLRTPLTSIMATAEILLNMTKKGNAQHTMVEAIYNDSKWLHSLVENVLSLSRLQQGKLPLEKEKEVLEEVIGEVIRQIKGHFPSQKINVTMPNEVLFVPMDAKLIMQVFINLLENAIKHSPKENTIRIIVENDDKQNEVVIIVQDEGEGIKEKDLSHIFKSFYTTNWREMNKKSRMGLGLSICDTIIRAHSGKITARNRTDRSGAEFIFSLPLEEVDDDDTVQ